MDIHKEVRDLDCQYWKGGMCKETEKPSGRIHPCPTEHGGECYFEDGSEENHN